MAKEKSRRNEGCNKRLEIGWEEKVRVGSGERVFASPETSTRSNGKVSGEVCQAATVVPRYQLCLFMVH